MAHSVRHALCALPHAIMAGAAFQITIHQARVQALFKRLAQRMDDMTPVMAEIGEIVTESVQRNFEEHRSPEGEKWKELSPATVISKVLRGRNTDDILIDKTTLIKSIHPRASKDRVRVGTDVIYAAIHQFGGETGKGHAVDMPARPFLGIRAEDWPEIEDTINDWLTAATP